MSGSLSSLTESNYTVCKSLESEFAEDGNYDFGALNVYLRLRPLINQEVVGTGDGNSPIMDIIDSRTLAVKHCGLSNRNGESFRFTFNHIFTPNDSQREVFQTGIQREVSSFIKQDSSLIFTYGATSAGKTYTLIGNRDNPGIIPMALENIFNSIDPCSVSLLSFEPIRYCDIRTITSDDMKKILELKENLLLGYKPIKDVSTHSLSDEEYTRSNVSLWLSCIEVYNEKLYDLYKKDSKVLTISEDTAGRSYVRGLTWIPVDDFEDAMYLLDVGKKNLHFASTQLNRCSSRGHCIFSIKMVTVDDIEDPNGGCVNSLTFCDLAGKERSHKSARNDHHMKEAGNINTSLLVLGQCFQHLKTLKNGKAQVGPFRNSKLTRLFKNALSGHGRITLIVNISNCSHMLNETISVLKFSCLASRVVRDYKSDVSEFEKTFANKTMSFRQRLHRLSAASSVAVREAKNIPKIDSQAKIQNLMCIIGNLKLEINLLKERFANQECLIKSDVCKSTADAVKEYTEIIQSNHEDQIDNLHEHYQKKLDLQKQQFETYLSEFKFKVGKETDKIQESTDSSDILQNEQAQMLKEAEEEFSKIQQEKDDLMIELSSLRSVNEKYMAQVRELTEQNDNLKETVKKLMEEKTNKSATSSLRDISHSIINVQSPELLSKNTRMRKRKINEKLNSILSIYENTDSPAPKGNDYKRKLRRRTQKETGQLRKTRLYTATEMYS